MRIIVLVLAAGCAPSTPGEPTWLADVRPIVAANCIRCHSGDGLGGAPTSFRLDVYDDTCRDGQTVSGAATMAKFMAARASKRGDMPPRGATLFGRQKDIIDGWQDTAALGTRPDNHPPAAALTAPLGTIDNAASATVGVEVTDPDRDLVTGTLLANGMAIGALRNGTQELTWNTSVVPAGSYALTAALDDGSGSATSELGTVTVVQTATELPPAVSFTRPYADELVVVPDDIIVTFNTSGLEVTVSATDGTQTIDLTPQAGSKTNYRSGPVPEGTSWRIVATVRARVAGPPTTVRSPIFMVSHKTTGIKYADVQALLMTKCAVCHDPNTIASAGVGNCDIPLPNFTVYNAERFKEISGRAWRKVVQLREMPPKSRTVVVGSADLTEDERTQLGEWFFAGAPQ